MGSFKFFDFTKPGKGVKKDEQNRRRIVLFFKLLYQKFWTLALLNCIFAIFPTTALVIMILVFSFLGGNSFLMFLPIIPVSLFIPSLFYIVRNCVMREPIFFKQDFLGKIRENWKPALCNGVFIYLYAVLLSYVLFFFWRNMDMFGNLSFVFLALTILSFIVFISAQYYIYTMMVTFELKYRHLLKNAIILTLTSFFRNVLVTLILSLIWGILILIALTTGFVGFAILFVFVMVIGFSLSAFIILFITYPVIEKRLLIPYFSENKTPEQHHPEKEKDDAGEEPEESVPEKPLGDYVFRNGRLVRISNKEEEESIFSDKG